MWAAEIGRRRILADVDDALADRAGAREMLEIPIERIIEVEMTPEEAQKVFP